MFEFSKMCVCFSEEQAGRDALVDRYNAQVANGYTKSIYVYICVYVYVYIPAYMCVSVDLH